VVSHLVRYEVGGSIRRSWKTNSAAASRTLVPVRENRVRGSTSGVVRDRTLASREVEPVDRAEIALFHLGPEGK